MRLGCREILVSVMLGALFFSVALAKRDNEVQSLESFYNSARTFYDNNQIDSAIVYLNQCLDLDHKFAPAHYLLGQIFLYKDGIYNRRLSALSLKEAIKADKSNSEYHYCLGYTYEKQGFLENALDEYKTATRLDSTDFRPYTRIAKINEKLGLRYDDDKYFRRSLDAAMHAAQISNDPVQYYSQAVSLYQMALYDSSAKVLSDVIGTADSAAVLSECFLLLGTDLVCLNKFDSAYIAFERGRILMSDLARAEMDDIRFLMPASEYGKYQNESFYGQEQLAKQFWGQLDPDPTTPINERQVVHYARFIHAQLTFSIPERSIPGWKTKRGELYIRYGAPSQQTYILGEGASSPRWIWVYDQFKDPATFVFEDTFLNGEFDFPFPDKNWSADDYAKDPARLAEMLGNAQPQTFAYSPGTGPLKFAFMPRQFKGISGRTDLEVFTAIPYSEIKYQRDGQYADGTIDWRQSLRYQNWELADSSRAMRTYRILASQVDNQTMSMSDRLRLSEYSDSLVFSISIRDTLSGHIGISTKGIRLRNFHKNQVEISDIVLARRIDQPQGVINFKRGELGIYSNLDNRYFASEPIMLYFEIYNLAKGSDGKTSYTIRQTIAQKRSGGIFGSVRQALTGKDLQEVVITYDGSSVKSDENRVLTLDASGFEAGNYMLSIEINDLLSGKSARASEDIVVYR
jgi:GWxTD domain-containing protein